MGPIHMLYIHDCICTCSVLLGMTASVSLSSNCWTPSGNTSSLVPSSAELTTQDNRQYITHERREGENRTVDMEDVRGVPMRTAGLHTELVSGLKLETTISATEEGTKRDSKLKKHLVLYTHSKWKKSEGKRFPPILAHTWHLSSPTLVTFPTYVGL